MSESLLMILLEPDTYLWLSALALVVLTLPLLVFWRRMRRRRWLRCCLLLALLCFWYVLLYGSFVGVRHLDVRQVEFASKDLPAAFDGYRIVQFSDAHVHSFDGWRRPLLSRAIDSINAQGADLIVFTGDLQNKQPSEIAPYLSELARLKAKDGVLSVLGNHDYPMYIDADPYQQALNLEAVVSQESKAGWNVLLNGRRTIRRGNDCIYVAGMENDGEGRFPQLGNIQMSLYGANRNDFVVMLEHDPTAWRRKILRHCHAQLTLSGHTHGGQFSVFGWTPASLHYRECMGVYEIGGRYIHVTKGLSGGIPVRIGATPEVVAINLRKAK